MDFLKQIFGGFMGSGDQGSIEQVAAPPIQLAGYPEADKARGTWADTLQQWGSQPGYGAIQPDWSSIWDNARGKVQRYFGGGPEGPGVDAQVAAKSATRGTADQAAGDAMLQRSKFQQGNMLQDLAVQQATNEAQLGESGRKDWMSSLMQLAGLKPAYSSGGSTTTKYGAPAGAQLGKGIAQTAAGGGGIMDMLNPILNMFGLGGQGGGEQSGDTGIGDVSGDGEDMWSDPSTYMDIAKLAMMFI